MLLVHACAPPNHTKWWMSSSLPKYCNELHHWELKLRLFCSLNPNPTPNPLNPACLLIIHSHNLLAYIHAYVHIA